jgi:hypothetical protein
VRVISLRLSSLSAIVLIGLLPRPASAGPSDPSATPAPRAAESSVSIAADTASQPAASPAASTQAPAAADDDADQDDEAVLDPAEPAYDIINLPTTLRLPRHKGNFRLTHRFAGNLRSGSFSEQASNLFGLDQGATIGFEYRYGIARHAQVAVYRTNASKTIQIHGKYDALHQGSSMPLSVSALASVEGTNNFQQEYAPAVGAVLSRKIADRFAAYVVPTWVDNTAAAVLGSPRRSTFYVGIGGRARVLPSLYLVGELSPRAAGDAPGVTEYGFGIETRVGGHVFALTFTNTSGTTDAQIARGGTAHALYLGFNLARKFF